MPEGDSIHHAAVRLRPVLLGGPLERVASPSERTAPKRWDKRLKGQTVERIEARGKNLLIFFAGELVLHSHLRMTGSWAVRTTGDQWPRSTRRAWLVMGRGDKDVIEFDGPFLELRTHHDVAIDPRLRALGPDICVPAQVDPARVLTRLRQDDPTRPVGDALLNQRTVAGIGNVWKSEACWAQKVDPTKPLSETPDRDLTAMIEWTAPRIQRCAKLGTHLRPKQVYGQDGRPCPRCRTPISKRQLGDDNRPTFWCTGCQS
ncbi:DNA-formamidopyrimidine glycosylase family protein [Patulibacter sp.]|uniref:DNA-formamidopyrimidine glycosylase family protein n=1 Tax=Patulibacter sp. TaxID=1912859 RepID=UPI002723CD05|nr:DNA-formamidopyrimidine glycosylase family protein [Patulibacter sp.]MDO9408171.1 DNA-formamidopyrimidine glycosylase family protein [Patulibacter sp.]